MTTLFLFAHQDDEFGVFHEIRQTLVRGERAVCIYLTDGGGGKATPEARNAESTRALTGLGVPRGDIEFLGTKIGIHDGTLPENLQRCLDELVVRADQLAPVRRVVTHAWEGGHQDHDAAHLLGVALAVRLNILEASRQYPLYRAPGNRFFLTFSSPMPENGPVERNKIPLNDRLASLARMTCYPSQLRVMLKLAPQQAWDYLTDGTQKLQPLSVERLYTRPAAEFLYEKWDMFSYDKFRQLADRFLARQSLN